MSVTASPTRPKIGDNLASYSLEQRDTLFDHTRAAARLSGGGGADQNQAYDSL